MKDRISLDDYSPSKQQQAQLRILFEILDTAKSRGIVIYLVGGYGLDALYGRLTRDHRDLDLYISEKHIALFENVLASLDFTPSGNFVGVVKKKEFVHPDFPKNFTVEYGLLEDARKLMKSQYDLKSILPTEPIGHLNGKNILVPSLAAFKITIEINNSLIENHTEPYRHQAWLDTIMPKLESKYSEKHKLGTN